MQLWKIHLNIIGQIICLSLYERRFIWLIFPEGCCALSVVKLDFLTQPPILQTESKPIHIIGQTHKLNGASVRSQNIDFMDVSKDKNITAIQSLPHWVYNIQYLLWIVHDIELYMDVTDCELTVATVM